MDKLKIMVVDDESRMRKLVKDFLKKKDFEVIEAADGEEALDIFFKDKSISLIICDVMMPKINGFDVVKEIRQYSQVPIIMLTAKGEESDELNGFDLGVDEYISKPFSPKILVARVEAILRRSNNLSTGEVLKAGGIELDIAAHEVRIDGKEITDLNCITEILKNHKAGDVVSVTVKCNVKRLQREITLLDDKQVKKLLLDKNPFISRYGYRWWY